MRRLPTAADVQNAQAIAARNHAALADVQVTAGDEVTLRGWSMRPVQANGDAVILLHGQSDNWAGMLGYADMLLRHGYAVVLPNARAHGASGGELATYGVKEAGDVRVWFDWVKAHDSPRCVDGLGESMGAALLLQGLTTTPGFCAVVAESPFASFREASYDRLAGLLGARAWLGRTLLRPAAEAGFLYARLRYGVDLEQASPEDAVAGSRVPVLLIHGKQDTNLPPRNSELIVERSTGRTPAVALWEPAHAGHTGAAGAEPAEFEKRVVGWFEGRGAQDGEEGFLGQLFGLGRIGNAAPEESEEGLFVAFKERGEGVGGAARECYHQLLVGEGPFGIWRGIEHDGWLGCL